MAHAWSELHQQVHQRKQGEHLEHVQPSDVEAFIWRWLRHIGGLVLEFFKHMSTTPTPAGAPPGPELQCTIIAGPAALSAQLVLLAIVLSALALKRHRERPRRALNIWGLDISKQAFSAGAGHLCGMGIAVVAHRSSAGVSECAWYLCVYLCDCTLGISIAILLHKAMGRMARLYYQRLQASKDEDFEHHWSQSLIESGNYGDPPQVRRWAIQVAGWVTCVISARLTVGTCVILSIPLTKALLLALDRKFVGHRDMFLFTVMVGLPMMLNVGQAWIQDQVLKFRHKRLIRRVAGDGRDRSSDSGERERERGERDPRDGGRGGLMHDPRDRSPYRERDGDEGIPLLGHSGGDLGTLGGSRSKSTKEIAALL